MSFRLTLDKSTEWCDICEYRNGANEAEGPRPFITLRAKEKNVREQHVILVHLDCLERKIAKAKKKAERAA